MMKPMILAAALVFSTALQAAGMEDDPLIGTLKLDQLEVRGTDAGNVTAWKANAWLGKDLHKLWLRTEGNYRDGQTEDAELQLLYSHGLTAFWDVQAGWRRDQQPRPTRDWLALEIQGLAPYHFDVNVSLFVGKGGHSAARLDAESEYRFSQRLILSPSLETNLFSKEDPERGLGRGLSDIKLGLRLRYEIRREFAPYVGIQWTGLYGDTANFAKAAGGKSSETMLVAGIRAWF